jgi:hypothetical protein
MPEEDLDSAVVLLEDSIRDALFMRAQAECAEIIERLSDWVSNAVRERVRRREEDLKPIAATLAIPLTPNARFDGIAEYSFRKIHNALREGRSVGRVLDGMTGERASVTDQVAEKGQVPWAHGEFGVRLNQSSRDGDLSARLERVEAPPAAERHEPVIGGCTDLTAERGTKSQHRFQARAESTGDRAALQLPGGWIHREDIEAGSTLKLGNRRVAALIRQEDAGLAG